MEKNDLLRTEKYFPQGAQRFPLRVFFLSGRREFFLPIVTKPLAH